VNRNGEISIKGEPGLTALQRRLLEREGVRLDGRGRIHWDRHGWHGPGRATGPEAPPREYPTR